MRNNREFGFICGDFSVGMSSNGFVLPGSDNDFFRKSMIPEADQAQITGHYTLLVHHGGEVVCEAPVQVGWATHASQAEPFLGMKADDGRALRLLLGLYSGKHVELQFTPRECVAG
jgi:hypothetical protein